MKVFVHFLLVRLNALDAALVEGAQGIGEEPHRLKEIMNGDGHEDVQLKIALGRRDTDGGIVRHDLHGDHGDGFALGGIDLARHDGASRLVRRNEDLAEAAARPARQPANVIGDLHHIRRQTLESAVGENHFVLAGERMEFIGRGDEIKAGEVADNARRFLSESLGRVQSGPDSSAAEGQAL